jgi:hypothetical protein
VAVYCHAAFLCLISSHQETEKVLCFLAALEKACGFPALIPVLRNENRLPEKWKDLSSCEEKKKRKHARGRRRLENPPQRRSPPENHLNDKAEAKFIQVSTPK